MPGPRAVSVSKVGEALSTPGVDPGVEIKSHRSVKCTQMRALGGGEQGCVVLATPMQLRGRAVATGVGGVMILGLSGRQNLSVY